MLHEATIERFLFSSPVQALQVRKWRALLYHTTTSFLKHELEGSVSHCLKWIFSQVPEKGGGRGEASEISIMGKGGEGGGSPRNSEISEKTRK